MPSGLGVTPGDWPDQAAPEMGLDFLVQQAEGRCPSAAPSPEQKVYVLVRRDLPWPVRCVQAAHVVMVLMRNRKMNWGSCGPAVVMLGVANEQELRQWYTGQLFDQWPVGFFEPDLINQLTAVAYYGQPIEGFSELKLL